MFSVLPTSCCRLTADSVRTTSHMYPLLSPLLFGQGICTVWYGLRKHWTSVTKQTHQVILNNNKRKELKSLQLSPWSHSKLIYLLIEPQASIVDWGKIKVHRFLTTKYSGHSTLENLRLTKNCSTWYIERDYNGFFFRYRFRAGANRTSKCYPV